MSQKEINEYQPDSRNVGARQKWLCFLSVALGTLIAYSDASMVNIALPTLARYFEIDISVIEAVVTFYLLMITGLVIIFGRAADMYGRKRLYVIGFAAFIVASALCGAAPSFWLLIVLRCVQGAGAALLLANGAAIITDNFPPEERGKALGMMGSVIAFAVISGPLTGGLLSDHIGWRAVFYVNIPVGIIGLLIAIRVLPSQPLPKDKERFDGGGAITLLAFLSCFLFFLNVASNPEFRAAKFSLLAAATALLCAGFIFIESRVEHPLLDLSLFRSRIFSAAAVSSFLSFWAMSAMSFLLPFYLERVLLFSPTQSGSMLAPVALFLVVFAPLGGHLADRFGTRIVCTIGALINCLGLVFLSTLSMDTSQLGVILRMIPFGIGSGLFQPPNNSSMMGAVASNRVGIASGMISAIKNFGSMSGVAATSAIFTIVQMNALARLQAGSGVTEIIERQAFVSGVRVMFLISAAICSIAVVTSFIRGEEKSENKQEKLAAVKL